MSSDSLSYLTSKSRNVLTHWKILVLLSLVLLMLPAFGAAPARSSSPSQISQQAASSVSPSVAADFSLTANPASITTTAGSTRTTQITVTSLNGFVGQVYLKALSFEYPVSFPVSLNPQIVTLSAGGTASSTLTITVPSGASAGDNTVLVESSGGCTSFHFLDISVTVTGPDFTIVSEKTHLTLAQSGSDTAKVDLTSLNGFSGMVSLFSFSQFTTSLNPASVTLAPAGTASSIFTIAVPATVDPGNYTVSVDASYSIGSTFLFHSADIGVTVTGPTIALTASKYSLTLVAGGASNSSTIFVTPSGGFTGSVSLAASPLTPLSPSLSASTVTVPPVASSVLTVTAPLGTKAQTYVIDITGTSGTVHGSTLLSVKVKQPDFEISADPYFVAVVAGGSSCTSTISTSSILGFGASVGLVLKGVSSVTAALNPTSIGVPGTSTLTVSAPSGAVPGFYSLDVNGTSSSPPRTHSVSIGVLVIGPDFELSASPDPLTVMAGNSGTSTISLTPILQFSGTVSLTASSSNSGIVPTLSSPSITGSQTSTLTVAVALGTPPGDFYSVQVNGTSGQLTHSIYLTIKVTGPGFYITANPSPVTVTAGTPATSTITINPTNGFSSSIDLFASSDSQNLNASIQPTTVTSGSYVATLSVNSTIPGSYKVDITGFSTTTTGGFLYNSTTVNVNVVGPDFTLSTSPTSLTITAGSSKTSTITVTALNGFNKPVALTASAPTGLTPTLLPTTITPPATTSTLTIPVDPSVTPGPYTVDIQATGGSITRTVQLTVNVAGFTLAATPDTLAIAQGTSQSSTITVAPQNGFTGTVQLSSSVQAGLTITLTPASITGSGTSQLAITAASSISPGMYLVNVTGTSGSLNQKVTITVTVPIPDFDISPSTPTTVPCTFPNSCPTTITITPLNGFTGTVSFTASPSTGLLCDPITSITLPTMQTILSCHSITTGTFTVTVTAISGTLSHTTGVITYNVAQAPDFSISAGPVAPASILAGASGTSTITVSSAAGFNGPVSFTVSASTPSGLTCTIPANVNGQGTTSLTCRATIAGDYTVTVTGTSGSLTHTTASILFHVTDFTITAAPTSATPLAGAAATSTITLAPVNGFIGTVSLTSSISPTTGLTCTLTSSSILLGASQTSTLSCTGSAGTYTVTVTGSSGTLSHSATVIYTVQDFAIAASPTSVPANIGTSATSTITATAVNGFGGVVSLSASISPATGLTCTLSPTGVTGSGASTLSCTSSVSGTFTVTVTGTTGTLSHSATVTYSVAVPDFTVYASPTTFTVNPGVMGTSTITVAPVNSFTGTVTLTSSISPSTGLTCTLTPVGIVLGASQASTLSCNGSAGTYTVTVTGTSGSLTHTATVTVKVNVSGFTISASSPAPDSRGRTVTSRITVTPVNGFTGTVSLSDTPLPNGLTCSPISPGSVTLSSSAIATLACHSTEDGTLTVTITGTSGSLTVQATATFTFQTPDITITSTTPASITSSQSTTSTITVSPTYGFTGTVTLAISAPSGITCTVDHSTLQGSGTATLTCTSITPNDYTVTVTATGGAATHTTSQTFHVSAAPSPAAPAPTIFGLPSVAFYGIIGVLVAAVIGGIAVVIRRRNS